MTEIALRPPEGGELETLKERIRLIASTEFVPKAYRGKPHEILACVLTGRALGFDEMTSLRLIDVVDGKPTLSAQAMTALVRKAGHSITGDANPERAIARGKRADSGDEMTVTWTVEMAKRVGLASKQNWKNYPEAMLWARAVSQLCRMLFADVLAGIAYVPEELEDSDPIGHLQAPDGDHPDSRTAASAEPSLTAQEHRKDGTEEAEVAEVLEGAVVEEDPPPPLFDVPPTVKARLYE